MSDDFRYGTYTYNFSAIYVRFSFFNSLFDFNFSLYTVLVITFITFAIHNIIKTKTIIRVDTRHVVPMFHFITGSVPMETNLLAHHHSSPRENIVLLCSFWPSGVRTGVFTKKNCGWSTKKYDDLNDPGHHCCCTFHTIII